ncbi:MAG: 4-(cytidine 5'-diphospho)-2-C-methyl-D-erythritol kinase [endosymbiont of Seepiophila jonesi]|uniref:4-diphosphocytidyl-2-C-methyl-D-erythritol kinase n=1 Tax=endosymbiont of Lamellibrachia luymesi TaxID=2200907 RepID=A0A370E115_9GAMM|nr:MAG: 4-(cytidine 5'-diphospho)-2-C-methyl-D-erythritol kinase [endosymbiont of Seepiophila jonesi]RDH91710.1 MAG: 4-(cytidine 5'-diphospho)-2-C-methyl-D-erythritol kinase [endosymbiont of Lamellibrachia luymesi]
MPESIAWPAPAKLNLTLRIVGRRPDGYHELQTVFQFLDLQDELHFQPRSDGRIVLATPLPGVTPETDLTVRAANLLKQHTKPAQGVTISIDKHLPMGGGLGGGSSDAATTLVALNQIWETGLDNTTLAELSLALGADIPIFIHGRAAWAEGIGETLTDLDLPQPWYLVLAPGCHVSTAEIFSAPDLTRNSPRIRIRDFLEGDRRNDCLSIVRRRYKKVAAALDWLDQFAPAQMTGTGACVFAAFSDASTAEAVLNRLPADFVGFVARGINRSPLLTQVV